MSKALGEPKIVKIRKPRQCFGCLRKFAVGAEMTRVAFTDGGSAYSIYTCAVCEAVFAEWDRHDQEDGYNEGDVRDACPEDWEAMREKMEGAGGGGGIMEQYADEFERQ